MMVGMGGMRPLFGRAYWPQTLLRAPTPERFGALLRRSGFAKAMQAPEGFAKAQWRRWTQTVGMVGLVVMTQMV